jgi:hypothetical protein
MWDVCIGVETAAPRVGIAGFEAECLEITVVVTMRRLGGGRRRGERAWWQTRKLLGGSSAVARRHPTRHGLSWREESAGGRNIRGLRF